MKASKSDKNTVRGYSIGSDGMMEIIDVATDGERPLDVFGHPIELDGEIIELMGWPDKKAVMVAPFFAIGIEEGVPSECA